MTDKFLTIEDFEAYKKTMEEKLEKASKVKKNKEIVPRTPTEYQMFVKNNLPKIKAETPNITQTDAIRKVAELWNLNKAKLNDSTPKV